MADYIVISDWANHRIKKHLALDLSYVSKIGGTSSGSGIDEFSYPENVTNDGTNLYITDGGNARIVKRLASDLSYVSQIGSSGAGDDQFISPCGITLVVSSIPPDPPSIVSVVAGIRKNTISWSL